MNQQLPVISAGGWIWFYFPQWVQSPFLPDLSKSLKFFINSGSLSSISLQRSLLCLKIYCYPFPDLSSSFSPADFTPTLLQPISQPFSCVLLHYCTNICCICIVYMFHSNTLSTIIDNASVSLLWSFSQNMTGITRQHISQHLVIVTFYMKLTIQCSNKGALCPFLQPIHLVCIEMRGKLQI